MNRTSGGISPVVGETNDLFNQPAQASSFNDPTTGDPLLTDFWAGANLDAQIETGQSLDDLWISTFIRSKNWKPNAAGFNIDGATGKAEFSDVTVRGTIYATAGEIGGWTINATTITGGGLTLNSTGSIGTTTFVSGQTGWNISATGVAEFNNIIARGEFRTAVLTKNEIHATGGSLLVLGASVLKNSLTTVTTPATASLDLKDPPSGHAQLFSVNDIVRIKDGSGLDNWLKVTVVSDQTTFYRYTVDKQSGTNGTFYPGTAVVNYKQSTDGFVLLTSDLTNAPYMDIGVSGATPWTSTTNKVRVGNLGGITDTVFGALSGYGIWTDSGYFTGSIMATAGRIGSTTNYWNITAGSLAAVGSTNVEIRAGQTAYDTGTGFWLGLVSSVAKLSMGVGSGKGVTWDGTEFSIKTGASGAARIVIDSTDNTITFYNSSNAVVTQIGGGSGVSNALRVTLDASTTTAVKVSSSSTVDGMIGLDVQASTNFSMTGVNINLSNTGTGNDAAGVRVIHAGGASSSRGIYITKSGVGEGILIENSGTGKSMSISTTNNAAISLSVVNATAGGSANLVYLENAAAGNTINILSSSNANGAISISHTPTANSASLFIDHNFAYGAIELDVDGANASETYGLLLDVRNSSTGVVAGISMNTGGTGSGAYYALDVGGSSKFFESTAVGGTQDRKIRVRIGGTLYYIPCYTA